MHDPNPYRSKGRFDCSDKGCEGSRDEAHASHEQRQSEPEVECTKDEKECDICRFDNDGAIAQYAGLTWETYQSGGFQADDTAMTKRGNSYLRYYLVEAANSVRTHCEEYRQYYAAKAAETTRHAHKRALVLTARKLVRLIDVLLREGRIYQPPAERQQRTDGSAPHAARPQPQRRSKRAEAVR